MQYQRKEDGNLLVLFTPTEQLKLIEIIVNAFPQGRRTLDERDKLLYDFAGILDPLGIVSHCQDLPANQTRPKHLHVIWTKQDWSISNAKDEERKKRWLMFDKREEQRVKIRDAIIRDMGFDKAYAYTKAIEYYDKRKVKIVEEVLGIMDIVWDIKDEDCEKQPMDIQ